LNRRVDKIKKQNQKDVAHAVSTFRLY